MRLKFGDVIVHPRHKLVVILLGDRLVIQIAAGQLLGKDLVKDRILIVHDGFVDAAVGKGAGRNVYALPFLHERLHALSPAKGEQLGFQVIVIRDAVVSARRVQDPVSDIHHVQQTPEFLLCQIQLHDAGLLSDKGQLPGGKPSYHYIQKQTVFLLLISRKSRK